MTRMPIALIVAALFIRTEATASASHARPFIVLENVDGRPQWLLAPVYVTTQAGAPESMTPFQIFDDRNLPKNPLYLASKPADMSYCYAGGGPLPVLRVDVVPADGAAGTPTKGAFFLKCISPAVKDGAQGRIIAWWGEAPNAELQGGTPREEFQRIMKFFGDGK